MQAAAVTIADEPEELNEKKEKRHKVLMKLESMLPFRQKLVWQLRMHEELSYVEIGRLLQISPGAARSSFYKAKRKVVGALKRYRNNEEMKKSVKKVKEPVHEMNVQVVNRDIRPGR
jgi:DNA-directed RNA polymerase specialized sigma24 family protein